MHGHARTVSFLALKMATSESSNLQVKYDPRDQMIRYTKDIERDITPARKLLEDYSKIPPDQVNAHIDAVVRVLAIHLCLSSLTVCPSLGLLSATKPGIFTHTLASLGSASLTSRSPFTLSTSPSLLASRILSILSYFSTSAAASAKISVDS